jgi:hypothetical protein
MRVWVLVVLSVLAATGISEAQAQKSRGTSIVVGSERNPGVESRAISFDYSSSHQPGAGNAAPVSTVAARGDAPRVPSVLVSSNTCSQRAGVGGAGGVDTSLREVIGDCIRDLPGYSPPDDGRERRPNVGALVWRALDEVRRIAPRPRLVVAPDAIGLTGLESYFWLAEAVAPVRAVASVPRITVVAEAAPDHYLWRFEPGADRMTDYPGRPWTKTRPGNIGHTYETKGHYDVSVEVVWEARWRVDDGAWRALGFFSTVDSRTYPVREVVPVLTQTG